MKKTEMSDAASNLLTIGSVSVAFMPFLLGDRLGLVIGGFMKEGAVLIDQFSNYVVWLVS